MLTADRNRSKYVKIICQNCAKNNTSVSHSLWYYLCVKNKILLFKQEFKLLFQVPSELSDGLTFIRICPPSKIIVTFAASVHTLPSLSLQYRKTVTYSENA